MRELFRKYLDNNCSPAEIRKLLAYFNIDENEVTLRRLITEWLEENREDEEEIQWQSNFSWALGFIKKHLSIDTVKLYVNFRKIEFQVSTEPSSIQLPFVFMDNTYRSIYNH